MCDIAIFGGCGRVRYGICGAWVGWVWMRPCLEGRFEKKRVKLRLWLMVLTMDDDGISFRFEHAFALSEAKVNSKKAPIGRKKKVRLSYQ